MRGCVQAQPPPVRSSPQEIAFPTGQAELSTPEFRATHKAVSAGAAWGLHGVCMGGLCSMLRGRACCAARQRLAPFALACLQPPGGGLLMSLDDMSAAFWASEAGGELKKAVEAAEVMEYSGPKVNVQR